MANVPIFVEKFLTGLSLGPFSFGILYHISGHMLMLSVIFSGIGVYNSIIAGSTFGQILPFYICIMIELYAYFSVAAIVDIKQKRKALKINLIDYLENHLSNRMQVTREDIRMLYGEEAKKPEMVKGLELLPIAGWLADKNEEVEWAGMEEEACKRPADIRKIHPGVGLEEEEAEALEDLLKEFLSLS